MKKSPLHTDVETWIRYNSSITQEKPPMIDELKISVAFTGDELYETIKLYDILRDMDFELTETQVQVFEKLQDAEVNGGFF